MPSPRILAATLALASLACVGLTQTSTGVHYEAPPPAPEPVRASGLLSAHAIDYGLAGGPDDVLLLVFASEIDPLGLVPESFGIVRADGQRVRPVEARLGPADEGDENRSALLTGEFGEPGADPIAVHVIGSLFSELGESFEGLDVAVSSLVSADRLLVVERLGASETRCPTAQQVVRTYWSDALAGVGAGDLAAIELQFADGSLRAPVDFDDQAHRDDEPGAISLGTPPGGEPGVGVADDNVLDLCVDLAVPVVRLRIAAGQFTDLDGHPTAAAEVTLPT